MFLVKKETVKLINIAIKQQIQQGRNQILQFLRVQLSSYTEDE